MLTWFRVPDPSCPSSGLRILVNETRATAAKSAPGGDAQAASRASGTKGPDTSTLADVICQHGPLPQPELIRVFVEVLKDLEFAHGQAMLHRDITTARIIREGGAYKLSDYGLSRMGTLRYMSPERCQGKPLDSRSDIYSLGVALYEAATGKLPFDDEMNYQVMDAQINKPPPPPRSVRPDLSADIERVILRALTKNPAGRFQSAADFRQVLESLLLPSRPVAAVAPAGGEARQPAQVAARPARRALRIPAGVIVALGVAVLAVGFLVLRPRVVPTGVKVPRFIGLTESEARMLAGSNALAFVKVDDTSPAGRVVSQMPEAGGRVRRTDTIRLSLSSGLVQVPSLAGYSLAQARDSLQKLTLAVVRIDSQYSDAYGPGMVSAVGPKPGSRIRPRAEVTLTVASGRATCPSCNARRAAGASFCERCGYRF